MSKTRNDSDGVLAVASYIFIDRYKKHTNEPISGVHYNKYMTLLNRELLDEGISIKLPHCWYRWGDEVVRYHMPHQITWNHEDSFYTIVDWYGPPPKYDPKDKIATRISEYVECFINKYSTKEKYELMKDAVYENAPYEFQKEYKKLREISLILSKKNREFSDQKDNVIKPLFEQAMSVFPKLEFKRISLERNAFEELFRMALEKDLMETELNTIAEDFWFFFCYFLRLDRKCHENVPQSTLKIWRDALPFEIAKYHANIEDMFYHLSSDEGVSSIANKFLTQRMKRKIEEKEALSYLDDLDFSDFEKFIDSMRGRSG